MSNGAGLQLLNIQLKNFLDNQVLKMTFRLAIEKVNTLRSIINIPVVQEATSTGMNREKLEKSRHPAWRRN